MGADFTIRIQDAGSSSGSGGSSGKSSGSGSGKSSSVGSGSGSSREVQNADRKLDRQLNDISRKTTTTFKQSLTDGFGGATQAASSIVRGNVLGALAGIRQVQSAINGVTQQRSVVDRSVVDGSVRPAGQPAVRTSAGSPAGSVPGSSAQRAPTPPPIATTATRSAVGRGVASSAVSTGSAARSTAPAVVSGGARAASAGALSSAAGGAAAAAVPLAVVAAVVVAFVAAIGAAVLATKKFVQVMNSESQRLAVASPEVAAARLENELRETRRTFSDAQRIGPQVARFEQTKGDVEAAQAEVMMELKVIALQIFEELKPFIDLAVEMLKLQARDLAAVNAGLETIIEKLDGIWAFAGISNDFAANMADELKQVNESLGSENPEANDPFVQQFMNIGFEETIGPDVGIEPLGEL